jgi:hypothetical protein
MLRVRCITHDGDILITDCSSIEEVESLLWSFDNVDEYMELVGHKPYFYVFCRDEKTRRIRQMVRGLDYQRASSPRSVRG